MLTTKQFPYALRLIGAMASDIHEMKTIREHIEMLPKYVRPHITEEVLKIWGFDSSGYGEGGEDAYLDHLHTAMGYRHLDLVRDMQRWFTVRDPRLADDDFEVNVHGAFYATTKREPVLV